MSAVEQRLLKDLFTFASLCDIIELAASIEASGDMTEIVDTVNCLEGRR